MSIELAELVALAEALAEPGPQGEPGPTGPQGEPGEQGVEGPQGPEGPVGPKGGRGLRGAAGINGVDGVDGRPGADGARGATGSAGKDGSRGPKGDPGERGEQGPQGDRGPAGRDGGGGGSSTLRVLDHGVNVSNMGQILNIEGAASVSASGSLVTVTVDPSGGSDAYYVHEQMVSATTWTIAHGLGKKPAVTVVDSGGTAVVGDVTYLDNDSLEVSFGVPFGGAAYLN